MSRGMSWTLVEAVIKCMPYRWELESTRDARDYHLYSTTRHHSDHNSRARWAVECVQADTLVSTAKYAYLVGDGEIPAACKQHRMGNS